MQLMFNISHVPMCFLCFQGGPERGPGATQSLGHDADGFTPLYQAAMCLMEEVCIY